MSDADGLAGASGPAIFRYDELDSTQAEARQRIEAGGAELPLVVVAVRQRGGIGRFGRAWASPAGGLWFTSAWRLDDAAVHGLGLRLGMALLDGIERAADAGRGAELRLKWPNDVMLGGRKAAGVLTEIVPTRRGLRAALVGVGVDANVRPEDLPEPVRSHAAILCREWGRPVDVEVLLADLLARQAEAVRCRGVPEALVRRANERLYARGRRVVLARPDGQAAAGVLEGLDSEAKPILIGEDGGRIAGPFVGTVGAGTGDG